MTNSMGRLDPSLHAKLKVKAPEGVYTLALERRANYSFQPDLPPRLTLADLGGSPEGQLVIFNVGQKLYIVQAAAIDSKEPAAVVHFLQGNSSPSCYPTCHSHTQTLDEYDLLVGLNTGEVVLMSVRAQLQLGGGLARPAASLAINIDGSVNGSRCVAAAWVSGSQGRSFITAHRDGGVYLHQKVVGSSSDKQLLARTNSQSNLRPPVAAIQQPGSVGVTAAAPSPDGSLVAVACKDGVLRIYELATSALVAGFKSYYGGLLCCAWSPDSRYVAAGGEDDLVAVYGLAEACLVAVGQGHASWVSGVAFDPWLCHAIERPAAAAAAAPGTPSPSGEPTPIPMDTSSSASGEAIYRLASVGQDCQLLLWDVVVCEDTLAAVPSSLSLLGGGRDGAGSAPAFRDHHHLHTSLAQSQHGAGSRGSGAALPACIAPSLPRAEMPLMPFVAQQRMHSEPLSDILFTSSSIMTACHGGSVKAWRRPQAQQQGSVAPMDVGQ